MVPRLVPAPASLQRRDGAPFELGSATSIVVPADSGARAVGELLARRLRPATGFLLPVVAASANPTGDIRLELDASDSTLGDEGYTLASDQTGVRIHAAHPAGLFHGIGTLRQLLPPAIESDIHMGGVPWRVPAVEVTDRPRFAWRGAMLDVARHFFTVREVEQYIDLLALYKLNVLHLHLADDQGWRIAIRSRPKLAEIGGATQVGGGPGGYYSQSDYRELVRYAEARYITVVPEVDMPGHSNAALTAYPELSCSTRPAGLYSGIDVGWSTLCVEREDSYALLEDVLRELAELTPGPFLHVGGDEVQALTPAQYTRFVERVQDIVTRQGKRMVGWEEITSAHLAPSTVAQQWRSDSVVRAITYGAKVILSPGKHTYLDMKYTPETELGLHWAGYVGVRTAYDWDPATLVPGVGERDIVGVEAPIWTETLRNITAVEYLAVPRLPAIAEVAWSPQSGRRWSDFAERLAAQAPRWRLLGINYFPSTEIPW
jgi:hexosaminidase